ncbi:hypothetical protein ARMGADRAFT_219019 [Armillaria gallica]|uniref:Uncharacterized protein n=1 Tax=Armillaria gallica TaxID=47427 RepID=A0A2H3D7S5_ARMGA|nr:hypothetical protein ARMGADRAFT_219019 [Armillaria gallica]
MEVRQQNSYGVLDLLNLGAITLTLRYSNHATLKPFCQRCKGKTPQPSEALDVKGSFRDQTTCVPFSLLSAFVELISLCSMLSYFARRFPQCTDVFTSHGQLNATVRFRIVLRLPLAGWDR